MTRVERMLVRLKPWIKVASRYFFYAAVMAGTAIIVVLIIIALLTSTGML